MSEEGNEESPFDSEMQEYLQTFLDETEEQLDDLVETLLVLEDSRDNAEELNEAFRLIHSIKGSAGMMGLDRIMILTHHLENRFERFRSGVETIDEATMNLVLRCIDFLRECNRRLREGHSLSSPVELLEELQRLEREGSSPEVEQTETVQTEALQAGGEVSTSEPDSADDEVEPSQIGNHDANLCVEVTFRADLQLVDLKAMLITQRLAGLGEVRATDPDLEQWDEDQTLAQFTIWLESEVAVEQLESAASVDGVESVDVQILAVGADTSAAKSSQEHLDSDPEAVSQTSIESTEKPLDKAPGEATEQIVEEPASAEQPASDEPSGVLTDEVPEEQNTPVAPEVAEKPKPSSSKNETGSSTTSTTMRVDINRLDNLLNLTGELVINRARFEQISGQLSSTNGATSGQNRIREFCDRLRQAIRSIEDQTLSEDQQQALLQQLRSGLELMDEQSDRWEQIRRNVEWFGEAIDQLSRVSHNLQKGVLDTRMVPVGPLFNRFKRVARDLSKERGKQVQLQFDGEKTELDKHMIDELADPLVHLVRNSLDHGLESPDVRRAAGKSELGTISMKASHRGNNVYIDVQDDGSGIDLQKIRDKIVERGLLPAATVETLTPDQTLDYIWHPGFSTASKITDISGRGVGMDVVMNRIQHLNGSIEVQSEHGVGTCFTIRLPLTLAIINCLLVRVRDVVFCIPIDDIREIVSVSSGNIIEIQENRTFDVRDEYIALVEITDIFDWSDSGQKVDSSEAMANTREFEVVILKSGGKVMGLRVDELLGSQDMVVKSLSDNFVNIRGIAGASMLGDGRVCFMLDVSSSFQLVNGRLVRPR